VIKKPRTALVIVGEGPGRYELEEHTLNLVLASKVYLPVTGRLKKLIVSLAGATFMLTFKVNLRI